jgi:uncharacterized membrane protein YbhN (UPF0104 family)
VLIVVYFTFQLVGAINIWIIAIYMKRDSIGIKRIIPYCFVSNAIGAFTPVQAGELTLAPLLKKHGFNIGEGIAIVAIDKCITILVFGVVTLIGLYLYIPNLLNRRIWFLGVTFIGILFVMSIIARRIGITNIVKNVFKKWLLSIVNFFRSFLGFIRSHPYVLCLNLIITIVRILLSASTIYIGMGVFGFDGAHYLDILWLTSISRMTTYLPISFNGLGVVEGSAVVLLSLVKISAEITICAFFINRLIHYTSSFLIVAYSLIFTKYKLSFGKWNAKR